MICPEDSKFFMVANADSQAGIPVNVLIKPPRAVQPSEKIAETEAVRLAEKTGDRFYVLEAVAFVDIVDGIPRWTNV